MTQVPRPTIPNRLAIDDKNFNADFASLALACGGNRTMGTVLNFLVGRANYEAHERKLPESCRIIPISLKDRKKILSTLRISEKSFVDYLKAFRVWEYVDSKRYSHEHECKVNFDKIAEGIKNPPAPATRGRPKKKPSTFEEEESLPDSSEENASTSEEIPSTFSENASELPENASTFEKNASELLKRLERKVEANSRMLKDLAEKLKDFPKVFTDFPNMLNDLADSESSETRVQAQRGAFSASVILHYITLYHSNICDVTCDDEDASPSLGSDALEMFSDESDTTPPTSLEAFRKRKTDPQVPAIRIPRSEDLSPFAEDEALEETVRKVSDDHRQPFNVSANPAMPLYPIANNGYSPTDHAEPTNDGASQAVPGVANGYMNQPSPAQGETNGHPATGHRDCTNSYPDLACPDFAHDRQRLEATAHRDAHDRSQHDAIGRRRPDIAPLAQGDITHVDPLASRTDCDAAHGGDLPDRPDCAVSVDRRDVSTGGAGIGTAAPGMGMVLTADTALSPSVAPVVPPDGRQQTHGGAAPASPIESGSRAPGHEQTRSQTGESYPTLEAWQTARDGYNATLPLLWKALDVAARKQQYGNRFDRYRAGMLKAWEAIHAKPAPLRLLEPALTPEQQARCKAWYQRFIDYRSYEWTTQGQCINERKYIKLLVAKYSDAQIAVLHDYLFNRHFKWSKPDFRYKIGAYEVYTEAPSVIQILKAEKLHGSNGGNGHARPSEPTRPRFVPSEDDNIPLPVVKIVSGRGRRY